MTWEPGDRALVLVDKEARAGLAGLFGDGTVMEIEPGLLPVAP
jgi:hypothetical protein